MIHQISIAMVKLSETLEVAGIIKCTWRELVLVCAENGIHRVPDNVYDEGLGKEHMNETTKEEME
jgi:hypothetical protein